MSSQSEKDLSCSICQDIFNNPVILSCSHSFCKDCLQRWWSEKQVHLCPLCKELSSSNDPPCNLALKNLCETFLLERKQRTSTESEDLCSLHSKKLRLFCLNHQQPVCLICRDSKAHNNHSFRPIDEAVQDQKQDLLKFMKPLQEKVKLFKQVKEGFDDTAEHIRIQAQRTEKRIKEEFKAFHQFLQEEEEARISALREEEKLKSLAMKEKIEALNRQITIMTGTIKQTEESLRAADILFLTNYKSAKIRVQQRLLLGHPQMVLEALIEVPKHLGNLSYNIWSKMKKMKELVSYSPVVLDPNTAHPNIILSGDLTDVRLGQKQNLPENPERFDQHLCVLGSEGFNSGTHSWDVEVRSDRYWGVGVVKESVVRKGHIQTGYWELALLEGKFTAKAPPLPDKVLQVTNLQRVRVQLDWNKGRLFFFDLDSKRLIHTFKQTFTEKMIPYFGLHGDQSLKILPMNISVTEQHETPLTAGFWGS